MISLFYDFIAYISDLTFNVYTTHLSSEILDSFILKVGFFELFYTVLLILFFIKFFKWFVVYLLSFLSVKFKRMLKK